MHGVVLANLKRFVEQRYDADTWDRVLVDAGLADKLFVPINIYPDEQMGALLASACKLCGLERDVFLEQFGQLLAEPLINLYTNLVPPDWGSRELLLNVEEQVHRVVRMKVPDAAPAGIFATETAERDLEVVYRSPRNMPTLAWGLIQGVATHYGDRVELLASDKLADGAQRYLIRLHPGG